MSPSTSSPTIGVLGAGSFGTALATVLASNGHGVKLWCHDPGLAQTLETTRENPVYHPGIPLPPGISVSASLPQVLQDATLVLSVVPSHVTREVMQQVLPHLNPAAILVSATKGIENESLMLMSQLIESLLPAHFQRQTAYLSGPSFARELMQRLPSMVTVAAHDLSVAEQVQRVFSSERFRAYSSDDVIGVEVAGAVKNVMAIAAGVADGLGFGHNTRAALITRGLAEMTRLGLKLGAQPVTFMGLAGMGDLVLTCTGDLSRNRTVGLRLGKGESLETILAGTHQVAEGVKTSKAVHFLSRKLGVDMPIVETVYQLLYEGRSPKAAVGELMGRPLKRERE